MTDLDEIRSELKEFAKPEKKGGHSPREERIIAGFEEIQRFVEEHGRIPQHGESNDIFERLYAVRLDRLRALEECQTLLIPLDHQGLLNGAAQIQPRSSEAMTDDEILAQLEDFKSSSDITELRHVRSRAEIQAAEEVANREKCKDFDLFEPLFKQIDVELKSGVRQARRFKRDAKVEKGDFFILGGQVVYIAEQGELFRTPNGTPDARLRVIYSNGTESNLLMRSLQRALYKDDTGRRLTEPDVGPLFGQNLDDEDIESGTIYVLRSLSDHPYIAQHRNLIHKIGVTGGSIESRIANAKHDATYLLADVEIVASYKLANINRTKLENIFHRVFAPAMIDLTIHDRFGNPVQPREWFLVPLAVIDETVERIRDGSITSMIYDATTAKMATISRSTPSL